MWSLKVIDCISIILKALEVIMTILFDSMEDSTMDDTSTDYYTEDSMDSDAAMVDDLTDNSDPLMDKIEAEFEAIDEIEQEIQELRDEEFATLDYLEQQIRELKEAEFATIASIEQRIKDLREEEKQIEENLEADMNVEFNTFDASTCFDDDMSGCCSDC